MIVINAAVLDRFVRKHRDAAAGLERWLAVARLSKWQSLQDVRRLFPSADGVPVEHSRETIIATVFNIKGNRYRLITVVDYEGEVVAVREILTHAEYDKDAWKDRL